MRFDHFLAAASADMLAASPVLAAPANPAASLSVAQGLRTGSDTTHESKLLGLPLIFVVIGAIVVIMTVVLISDNNDSK
jgi:hypothetical protein